jgi:hypothetical protein
MAIWRDDDLAKQVLDNLGIDFTIKTIKCDDIDIEASRHNLARVTALDTSVSANYMERMKIGDAFPRIVVRGGLKSGKYVIVGGNHRFDAFMKTGGKTIEVMLIVVSDLQFNISAKSLNTVNGTPPSLQERCEQAASLCVAYKISVADASRAMGISSGMLTNTMNANEVKDIASREGIKVTWKISISRELGTLAKTDEPVLVDILKGISGQVVSVDDIQELKREIAKFRVESSKREAVAKWLGARTKVKSRVRTQSPIRDKIRQSAKCLSSSIDNASILTQTQLSREEAAEAVKSMESTLSALRRLLAIG